MPDGAGLPEKLLESLKESARKFKKRQLAASLILLLAGAAMLISGTLSSPAENGGKGLDFVTFLRIGGPVLMLLWLLSLGLILYNAAKRGRVVGVL